MYYRHLMTLDIGNDALLCKVFPASLQGQALSWFHRLSPNSVDNFRDLSEAFVGQYLCSARYKQNISTLQNIKMQENESLRDFVKRFGPAVLQVEAYSMDAVLQIFKRSICLGTPFFESLAKKPLTTMDDLFRRASKYSMPQPSSRRQEEKSRPELPPLTPLSISYEKLLPRIQDLSGFRWPGPLRADPSKRDHSRKCAYHKEHGHTTETCRSLHYLVERLIKAGHLRQYLHSDARDRDTSLNRDSGTPRTPAAPKAIINYIHGGPLDEEYNSKQKRQRLLRAASVREHINSIRPGITGRGPQPIDGTIIFPPVDPTRILQPHRDVLILSLGMRDFDVRRILVDPGSSADLLQASVISHMGRDLSGLENPGRILSGFNGVATTSLGDIVMPVQVGPITLNVQFSVVQDLSPFNVILGRTWLHYMKVIPSTYHQMVSFLTEDRQIDLYDNQLAARQCYQIAQEVGTNQENKPLPEPTNALDQ
ncbi:hypothetical protein CK203_039662 [Vitis vinifera]|uniref:Retrotransposon gag domain-containing protein n=1 Tax=Vitis vinifera TaxID=29760 RepID=A0A438HFM6_VITVI|nr:hypothetical protein CK203_039662 [Vitis vinifera]